MIHGNILAVYHSATSPEHRRGFQWYLMAQAQARRLASRYELPLSTSVGVIAALSPGLEWLQNIVDAEALIKAFLENDEPPMVGVYGRRNRDKALSILRGADPVDVLGGLKVRSFYANILQPNNPDPVTIDRHAYCLAHGIRSERSGFASVDIKLTPKRYRETAEAYREIAADLNLLPNQLQATTWLAWKRTNE